MDRKEFSAIRQKLGKTQAQLAQLLGTSRKAIQSFEQGWRNVPVHVERQILFLAAVKHPTNKINMPCWVIRKCPTDVKQNCPAWEFQIGNLCWFINGTICHGEVQENWNEKMKICRKCSVFQSIFPDL